MFCKAISMSSSSRLSHAIVGWVRGLVSPALPCSTHTWFYTESFESLHSRYSISNNQCCGPYKDLCSMGPQNALLLIFHFEPSNLQEVNKLWCLSVCIRYLSWGGKHGSHQASFESEQHVDEKRSQIGGQRWQKATLLKSCCKLIFQSVSHSSLSLILRTISSWGKLPHILFYLNAQQRGHFCILTNKPVTNFLGIWAQRVKIITFQF